MILMTGSQKSFSVLLWLTLVVDLFVAGRSYIPQMYCKIVMQLLSYVSRGTSSYTADNVTDEF